MLGKTVVCVQVLRLLLLMLLVVMVLVFAHLCVIRLPLVMLRIGEMILPCFYMWSFTAAAA